MKNISLFILCLFLLSKVYAQTPLTHAPDFTAIDAKGNLQNLYSYLDDGKYVLVDFFYNECLVSQTHTAEVNEAFLAFGCNTADVIFLGVNFDNTDGELITFEHQFNLHYPNISGVEGAGNVIVDLYQIIAFPTIVLIAPNRSIVKQDIWPLSTVNIIDELLGVGIDTAYCPYAAVPFVERGDLPFSIFPNPVQDALTVELKLQEKTDIKIEIYDLCGRLVYDKNLSNRGKGIVSKSINVNHLQQGYYFLSIKTGAGAKATRKFIVE